jgi:hypothetical protein
LVFVEVEAPVSTFFNVTGTSVSTAAAGSVTTPETAPVVDVWAQTCEIAMITRTKTDMRSANEKLDDHP